MAKVDPRTYRAEEEERRKQYGGGDRQYPTFLRVDGKHRFVCMDIAHTRGKSKGTWGIAFLMVCVDPGLEGQVAVHTGWTDSMVHGVIAGGYGYDVPYENGLPAGGQNWDDFDPKPELLDEMLMIVTCGDQKKGGKGTDKADWNPTVKPDARRSPYVEILMEDKGNRTKKGEIILDTKYVNPLKERGVVGPYDVGEYRKVLQSKPVQDAIAVAKTWFADDCAKKVRDACDEADKRRGNGGGGGGGGHVEEPYEDSSIPF